MKLKVTNYKLGFVWFVITTILLCLPGHQFSSYDFFDIAHLDKLIHIFIFFLLSALFILPTEYSNSKYLIIVLLSSCYGILMEYVQKYFVPNRSFDIWDIVADIIGSFLAYILITKLLQKKKPL